MQISLGPTKLPKPVLSRLSIKTAKGDETTLEYVEFSGTHGTEGMSFENENQPIPLKFRVLINHKTNSVTFSCRFDSPNLHVKPALEAYRFMRALSMGGTLKIEHLETGLTIGEMNVPPNHFRCPDQWWLDAVEACVLIQEKTRKIIVLRENDEISPELLNTIFATASKIRTGKELFAGRELTLEAGKELAEKLYAQFGQGQITSLASQHEDEQTATIFGVEIPLGPVTFFVERVFLNEEERFKLQEALKTATCDSRFSIKFKIEDNSPVQAYYPRWLPPGEAKLLGPA